MIIGRYGELNFAEALNIVAIGLDKTDTYKRTCSERISECDRILSDLDHKLELDQLDAIAMTKLVKYRKFILEERRIAKDELEYTDSIISSCKQNTQILHNQLKDISNSFKNIAEKLENRIYIPRIEHKMFDIDAEIIQKRDVKKKMTYKDSKGRVCTPSNKEVNMEILYDKIQKQKMGVN